MLFQALWLIEGPSLASTTSLSMVNLGKHVVFEASTTHQLAMRCDVCGVHADTRQIVEAFQPYTHTHTHTHTHSGA